jgi:hypothetical protein
MTRTIYVCLGGEKSSMPMEVPANSTGIDLRKLVKQKYSELEKTNLKDIEFDSSRTYAPHLQDRFFERYDTPEKPLMITVAKLVKNTYPSPSNLFLAEGDFKTLARALCVSEKLFIRDCYSEILDDIITYTQKRQFERDTVPGLSLCIFLTGTPGIGKTAFLLFLIQHLLRLGPVMFKSKMRLDQYHYWDENGTHTVMKNIGSNYFDDERIFFVMDSCNIASTAGPRLICSSPRDSIDGQFRKTAASFFMPIWSWDEIQRCHRSVYVHLPENRLQ